MGSEVKRDAISMYLQCRLGLQHHKVILMDARRREFSNFLQSRRNELFTANLDVEASAGRSSGF
jgi:hypothetical protein